MAKQNKSTAPRPKRRKAGRGGAYWTLFVVCAALSFAGGFWYTYQMTSQVSVKDPSANEVPLASPMPNQALVTPGPDLPDEDPEEFHLQDVAVATPTPAPTPTPRSVAPAARATVEPAAKAPPPGVYRVQVGSYSSRDEAQAMVEELAVAGIDAMVVEDDGKYHAQIGAYGSRGRALSVADEVNTKGYSVTIRH